MLKDFALYGLLGLVMTANGMYYYTWGYWVVLLIVIIIDVTSKGFKN